MDEIIAAALGTLGFVVLFQAPKREYGFCAATGAMGWAAYLTFSYFGAGCGTASLGAAFILTIMARVLSALRRCPVTIFLVTGIFTLVPGAGLYYTVYYLLMNDYSRFMDKGLETFKIAGAIVLGIVFGFILPQEWFQKIGRMKENVGK